MICFVRPIIAALLLLVPIAAQAQVITNPTTLAQFCVDRTVTPWVIGHTRKDGKCVGEMTQDPVTGATSSAPAALALQTPSSLNIAPTGNTFATIAAANVQANAVSATKREYLGAFGLNIDLGTGATNTSGPGDKVALYAGVTCKTSGGGACWATNFLATIYSGWTASGAFGTSVGEFDINNNDQNMGEADGAAGMGIPSAGAVGITGAGAYRSSSAVSIAGPGDHTIFNRGYVISANAVQQCSFCDYGIANIALDIRGTHNGAILDTSKATAGVAINLGNSQYITGVTSGGGGAQLMVFGSDNFLSFANLNVSGVRLAPPGIPASTGGSFQAKGQFISQDTSGNPAFGVNCAAGSFNASTFTVTNGIVTHC